MKEEIKIILQSLTNKSKLVRRMEKEIIDILVRPRELRLFAQKLNEEIQSATHIQGDDEPFYHFLLSVAYVALNESNAAKNSLFHAVQAFRIRGFYLNEVLCEWLFARIHFKDRNSVRAQHACEAAISIIKRLIQDCKTDVRYGQVNEYTKHLAQLENLLESIETLSPLEANMSSENHPPSSGEDYIPLPWLPRYDSVRAGLNGLIWAEPPTGNSTVIRTIEIDGTLCEIFSTSSSRRVQNRQVTLTRSMEYGWAKVEGQSMNASRPVCIEEGDYVLFTKQWQPGKDAIVIACRFLTDSEQTYMVKKYSSRNQTLVSETTDTTQDYSPIDMNEDYQILGTVIAVAKPKK